jgi:putative glutamine amidotransferase
MKPIIGILGNTFMTEPGAFVSAEKEYVNMGYIRGINRNGGIAVLLPTDTLLTDAASAMHIIDGRLIPGGEDVDPDYYGEEPLPKCGEIRPEIDAAWKNAYSYGREHRLPMLGICKGIQFINVMEGGTLYQDLDYMPGAHLKHQQRYSRTYLTHYVEIEKDSRLFQILGRPELRTNTMHHQAVKDPGRGLRIVGRARDGVIEALEDEEGLIEAVQWHPESLFDSNPVMNQLFADLVKRAERKV